MHSKKDGRPAHILLGWIKQRRWDGIGSWEYELSGGKKPAKTQGGRKKKGQNEEVKGEPLENGEAQVKGEDRRNEETTSQEKSDGEYWFKEIDLELDDR